ncbi:MAG: hypothetical protein ABJA82_01090 [Myxococcales bacterium]
MKTNRMTAARTFATAAAGAVVTMWMATARAEASEPTPARLFVQGGTGLVEVAHVETGVFLGPHLTVEAMAAWAAVFGARYGGGVTVAIGHAQGNRAPRHALLIGARLMLNSDATFDSHGDDLSSYIAAPIGYAFLSDGGFYFRAAVDLVVGRERTTHEGPTPDAPIIGHEWGVMGPMVTVAFGWAWPWSTAGTKEVKASP